MKLKRALRLARYDVARLKVAAGMVGGAAILMVGYLWNALLISNFKLETYVINSLVSITIYILTIVVVETRKLKTEKKHAIALAEIRKHQEWD